MAGKSVKRAKVDAQLSKEASNGLRMACGGKAEPPTRASGDHHDDLLATNNHGPEVEKLTMELDVATKCIEQLRREKDYEVRRVKDEEQARLSTALKDLEARLKAENEKAREAIKTRMEADASRLAGRYERTIKRLSGDLDKCRNELREEVEKRGMSSSTRGGFEAERVRLLTEVRELKAAKRRLEEKIESATEVDKQKTAEMKRVEEACKAEVAKVSKEANSEIRKLLEELKAKDHQLALLDRNQYPDRGASLPKQSTVTENQPSEPEVTSTSSLPKPVKSTVPVGEVVGKNGNHNNSEIISNLKKELEKANEKLSTSETERNRLRSRVDELCQELANRNETIASLRKRDTSADQKQKTQPKAVRFLLPGCTLPVLAREVDVTPTPSFDDDNVSVMSDMSCSSLSSTTSSVLSPDTTTLYDENIEKNYHTLLTEHLNLQRSIALLLSSWTGPTSSSTGSVTPTTAPPQPLPAAAADNLLLTSSDENNKQQPTCGPECVVEKDSLKVTVATLEDKLRHVEQSEEQLKQQLHEQQEQNEELEFRVLELEECVEKCKMTHSGNAAEDLFEKIRGMEDELSRSKDKLNYYKKLETDSDCGSINLGDYIEAIKHRQLDAEGRSEMLRLEVMALKRMLEGTIRFQPEIPTFQQKISRALDLELSSSKSGMTKLDLPVGDTDSDDLLSICPMNCSMSTTSGYDDDNSCASSVADMRLDDMPSEETWGFDDEELARTDDARENCQITDRKDQAAAAQETDESKDSNVPPDGYVPVETLKNMEQSWLTRIETMETRLAQAIQSEQRARDQVALLGEEKDRRIAALQKQVDMMEANEFRLAETIESLERLEMTFSQLSLSSPSSSSECSRNASVSDEDAPTAATSNIVIDTLDKPLDSILQTELFNEHRCTASGDGCIQCEAGRVLKNSLEKLRTAQNESDAVEKRIKELSEAESVESELLLPSSLVPGVVSGEEQFIDFKTEYRELEILVKELKKVLLLDSNMDDEPTAKVEGKLDNRCEEEEYSSCAVAVRPVGFPDQMTQSWSTVASENCLYSLPNSPIFDIQSPVLGLLRERCREYELTSQQLVQQVAKLEQERDSLRETVEGNETTIRELGIQLVELEASETSLKDEVTRLRTKEDWMSARNDELMELIGRLEATVDQHRAAEVEFRSRLDRHTTSQTELERELEDARDQAVADETRYRRWIGQLEDERTALRAAVDDLTERNTDLESREAGLLYRIRRLETAEVGLKNDVADLERALDEAGSRQSDDVQTSAIQAVVDVEDGSTQTDLESTVSETNTEEKYQQLVERAEFFKEMLEFCEQSNTALEIKLKQCATSEEVLRGTVAEYEKIDVMWQSKVETLEEKNANLVNQISVLESTITELKTRYDLKDDSPTQDECDFEKSRQNAMSALRGLLLLSDVADDVDDTELAYWAAVEGAAATHCDDVTETDLSSPFWSAVEARMGLKGDSDEERQLNDEKQHQSPTIPTTELETRPQLQLSPTMLSYSPDASSIDEKSATNGPTVATTNDLQPPVRSPRCRSADLFVTQSSREPSGERRTRRSSSESRDEAPTQFTTTDSVYGYSRVHADGSLSPVSPTSSSGLAINGESVMERIHRSRQFWSAKMSGTQSPSPSPSPAQNGRRSLIPRITPTSRSQQNPLSLETALSLPVIKSNPLSPTLILDDRKNRSYLPRPINDQQRPANEGKDIGDQTNNTDAKVKTEQSGQHITPKAYTTVLGPNRCITTSKFSYTGSSSQPPRAVRAAGKPTDSNKTLTNPPHSTKTNQLQRPVVRVSSSSTDVNFKPEVETSLLPGNSRD